MKFAVFILSHKRADRVETYETLRKSGYTGEMFIVIDDEDPQRLLYEERFTGEILIFSKYIHKRITDTVSAERIDSSPVYARNFIELWAKSHSLAGPHTASVFLAQDSLSSKFC